MRMLLTALMLFITFNVFSQSGRVSGEVFAAEDGSPIIGATVKVKGTNLATTTDIDGRFTIAGLQPGAKYIEVTYVGYKPATAEIKQGMKVYLEESTELLDEVIVLAFGKQKRASFTGSASVVSAEQIARQQVTNPIEALNGTVTGLNMVESNSFGSEPSITIRGIGSLNAGTSPLIVLDGLPYNGYMNDLNPADIASITVLKDAASNALYGARGANGVILITSKNAERGKTTVNFMAKWGSNHDGRVKYDMINNPGEYYEAFYLAQKNNFMNAQGQSEAMAHANANAMLSAPYTTGGLGYMVYSVPEGQLLIGTNGKLNPNATLGNRLSYNGEIYTLYPDNWLDEGMRDGFRQEYNVTVSSGNEKYSIYGSIGYLSDEGIAYNNDFERYTARLKADAQLYPFLKFGGSAAFNHSTTNLEQGVFRVLTEIAPIYPLYIRDQYGNIMTDKHGKMYDYGDGKVIGLQRAFCGSGNYIQEDLLDLNKNVSNSFNIQGYVQADIWDGLRFTLNGSVYITENRMSYGHNPYYGFYTDRGYVSTSHYRTHDFNTQQLLNYSKTFGQHQVDVLVGHEYTRTGQTALSASRRDVTLWETNKELSGAITDAGMGGYTTGYNVEGWLTRAQYDYESKYFLSGSFRRDGSSRFHPKHRWGNFWSAGAAWILTREEWFPKNPYVNMLKLKASYGEQGNDRIGDFLYTDTYNISSTNGAPAFVFNSKGNENITWETVGSFNTGLEFELFNSRLSGGLEFYVRNTRDMLMYFSTPLSLGYTGYYDNVGDMRNTGLELQLDAMLLSTPDVTWAVGMNLTWEKNRVTYLPEDKKLAENGGYLGYLDGNFFYGEGLPVATWRMPKYAGVNEEGRALFYKAGADGATTTTVNYDEADYYLCGSALPKVFGGFNTSIKFYGVDVNAQFNYSIGGKKYDSVYRALMTPPYESLTGAPVHKDIWNSWSPTNSTSNIPRWQFGEYNGTNTSDRFLTDASYLSLRSIAVGYTFPKNVISRLGLGNLRVFCQADNIYYWTKRKGFDPRLSSYYGSGSEFPMRTISGGLSVEF